MSHSFCQITPTDHFGWHAAYLEVYEKLFVPFKKQPIRLLEIGTDGGGGLRMYQNYFEQGAIVGVDISPTPDGVKNQPRVAHFQQDAYTVATVKSPVFGFYPWHIIIDDGPHTIGSQEFFVQNYPQLLTEDGIAIVEDIQEVGHVQHLARLVPEGFFSMGVDLRHCNGRYDDVLLVIWRR